MNRAARRQPATSKDPKGRTNVRPLGRSGARTAPARTGRRSLTGLLYPRGIGDIVSELRKVVWPAPQEALYLTMVVVVVAAILGAILGGLDIGFGWLLEKVLID